MTAKRIAPAVSLPWDAHPRERWTERACDALGLPSPKRARVLLTEATTARRESLAHEAVVALAGIVEAQTDRRITDRVKATREAIQCLRDVLDAMDEANDPDEWETVSAPDAAIEVQTRPLTDRERGFLDVGDLFGRKR